MTFGRASLLTYLVLFTALAFQGNQSVAQDDADKVKVKQDVAGITIMKKDPNSEYGQSVVLGHDAGTKVHLLLSISDSKILSLEADKKSSPTLTTDQGTKLDASDADNVGFYSTISADGLSVVIPVASKDFPKKGTKEIKVAGKVKLVLGDDLKTDEIKFKVEEGGELEFNGVKIEISRIDDGYEEGKKNVEFTTNKSWDVVESITFVDANGKAIESSDAGHSSFGFGDEMTYNFNYTLKGDVNKIAGAKFKYYSKTIEKTVELDQTATFGF